MKKIMALMITIAACHFCNGQFNEKDTIVTTITAKNRSLGFQAQVLPDYVNLLWTIGPNDQIGYFELYRSSDSMHFNLIKQFHPKTTGTNNSDYFFKDENPLRGKNYYRLVGYDRSTQEKRIVDLVADYLNEPRKLYPTLVPKGNQFYVNNYDGQELRLWVYNSSGQSIVRQQIVNSSTVYFTEMFSGGAYVYQLFDKNKMLVSSGKFVMQ